MTAQVIHSIMPLHPFPAASFTSPIATPSPTSEKDFAALCAGSPASRTPTLEASSSRPNMARARTSFGTAPVGGSFFIAPVPWVSSTSDADKGKAKDSTLASSARTVGGGHGRRPSRPRLHSLQSLNLNAGPASPSLTEESSGKAFILPAGPSRQPHHSLGRTSSRNAVESLQPLAESARSTLLAARRNSTQEARSNRPGTSISTWNPSPELPSSPEFVGATASSTEASSGALPRKPRTSMSPRLDSGLSEFGQMGAPFEGRGGVDGSAGDMSTRLRNFQSSTGAFLRRSKTVTAGIDSFAARRAESSPSQKTPAPNVASSAMTYGPSSGRSKDVPGLSQRRQTVSNVSPPSADLPFRGTSPSVTPVSQGPMRTLSYSQHTPEASNTSGLSVATGASSHIRRRGTLPNNQLEAKVVILGSQGVGKTSLVHRYTSGQFTVASVPSTIGASFLTKKLIVEEGVKVRLQLWDTAGQERFRSMAPMYYRGSHAAVIVYDITSMSSFMDVQTWIEELRKTMTSDLIIHIVGAKADLAYSQRQVDLDFARATVRSWTQAYQPLAGLEAAVSSTPAQASRIRPAATPASTGGAGAVLTDSDGSPGSPTRASSRLGNFGSLAIGSAASRFAAFQRGTSPGWGTGNISGGKAALGLGSSSGSSVGSVGSDDGRREGVTADREAFSTGGMGISGHDATWDRIQVSEVSAKDDRGIEEVFLAITKQLVERGAQIEAERARRERNSIFLSSSGGSTEGGAGESQPAINPNSWTCCG
ncbi:ras-domain-containing protein [Testicularia cyperi]|uniref:Ras-domain-containing protein n=1 Tax=Testicularia cyperi TaxID=1882483 RepID=A0A317XQQ9_9BASI|nr:ras-domain-containing protein [Testicularia cyperi]